MDKTGLKGQSPVWAGTWFGPWDGTGDAAPIPSAPVLGTLGHRMSPLEWGGLFLSPPWYFQLRWKCQFHNPVHPSSTQFRFGAWEEVIWGFQGGDGIEGRSQIIPLPPPKGTQLHGDEHEDFGCPCQGSGKGWWVTGPAQPGASVGFSHGSQPHGGSEAPSPPCNVSNSGGKGSHILKLWFLGSPHLPFWGIRGLLQLPISPSQPNTALRGRVGVSWGICWQLAAFITHGDAGWGKGMEPRRETQARGVSQHEGTRDSPQSCGMGGTGWVRADSRALEPFSICSFHQSQAVSPQRQKCAV